VSEVSTKRVKNDHGQYFTPPTVAAAMVGLLAADSTAPVLEPCSGEGVFLAALADAGFTNVQGVEIDERLDHGPHFEVENASFVSWQPEQRFAAVIGNPPYIRWKNLGSDQQTEIKKHHLWGTLFNSLSDYLTVFIAGAIELLEDGGELVFITPSFWMGTQHSGNLREWMLQRGCLTDLVVFGESEVFKGVASAIVIFRFVKGQKAATINRYKFVGRRRIGAEVALADPAQFERDVIPQFQRGKHWTVASAAEQAEADNLEAACVAVSDEMLVENAAIQRLGSYVEIANGMVSGLDKAFRFPDELIPTLNEAESAALMPVLKARDLKQIQPQKESFYIDVPLGLSEGEFERSYPHFVEHFAPHVEALKRRYAYNRELPYWEWAFRRSEKFLKSPVGKGFVPCKERLTSRPSVRFALAGPNVIATQDMTAFAPLEGVRESIEYIVGYLCLPQVSDWVRLRGLMKGGVAEFSERPLASIPFRFIDWDDADDVALHDAVQQIVKVAAEEGNVDSAVRALAELFASSSQRPVK
jgi:adenine-specific DNA-methyltransferase